MNEEFLAKKVVAPFLDNQDYGHELPFICRFVACPRGQGLTKKGYGGDRVERGHHPHLRPKHQLQLQSERQNLAKPGHAPPALPVSTPSLLKKPPLSIRTHPCQVAN
ncbi:hypothetical protein Syun_021026 [Stephania yunnanensis]|uniref:Uncharacterized protein n=1 Tax=Stephania yunnanensis TaxID=152371 RepID=A0AAP0IEZ2_9MAGN